MRFRALSNVGYSTLVIAAAIAGASPAPNHNHQHLHAVRRSEVFKTVDFGGPTVVAFVLNGKIVGQNEVCKGINDGNLKWEDPSNGPSDCPEITAKPTATNPGTEVAESGRPVAVQQKQEIKASPIESSQAPKPSTEQASRTPSQLSMIVSEPSTSTTSSDPAPIATSSEAESSSQETSNPQSSGIPEGQGLELEFPDGTIDCSTFPSEYGPIEVEWANLGGWAGIQYVTVEGDSVTHIVTAVPGGKGCIPGAMCSYACPPGYQKSQWPSTQGSTGQSVGGIHCNSNGKLSLTNPGLSKTLCMKGTGATTVHNKLSHNAAICRTDYPGL